MFDRSGTTGISWGSTGGYPYWAIPLQACRTPTYALLTAAWSPLNRSTQQISQILNAEYPQNF